MDAIAEIDGGEDFSISQLPSGYISYVGSLKKQREVGCDGDTAVLGR
jgi:hypothetical protein